jgi:hypothetical protein
MLLLMMSVKRRKKMLLRVSGIGVRMAWVGRRRELDPGMRAGRAVKG